MSPKQNSLYWREWAAVHRADPQADRHELHIRALGKDRSMKDLTNAEFDKVLGVFRSITRPADLDGQLRQIEQPRTRLLYTIDKQFGVNYATRVARDKFGVTDITRLTDEQLDQLRITLINRKRAMNRKLKPEKKVEEPF